MSDVFGFEDRGSHADQLVREHVHPLGVRLDLDDLATAIVFETNGIRKATDARHGGGVGSH